MTTPTPAEREEIKPLSTFSSDVLGVLRKMSLSDNGLQGVQMLGSSSIRAIRNASDYDGYQKVELEYKTNAAALKILAKRFKDNIRELMKTPYLVIADIKAGNLDACEAFPDDVKIHDNRVEGYDMAYTLNRLATMHSEGFIDDEELKRSIKLIKKAGRTPKPLEWLQLQDAVRFNVVRWKPADILAGKKDTRAGELSLAEAMGQPAVCKMDIVYWIQSTQRFSDISLIYELRNNGKILNDFVSTPEGIAESIRCNVLALKDKKPMKAIKRILSLARMLNKRDDAERVIEFLNGPAGLLYQIEADISTIEYLLQNDPHVSMSKLKLEFDSMKGRLANVYGLRDFILFEPKADALLDRLQKAPSTKEGGQQIAEVLQELSDHFMGSINSAAFHWLKQMHWFPDPPRAYLP